MSGFLERAKNTLAKIGGDREKFDKLDFGILKTMMCLAAVDGEISAAEWQKFQDLAASTRGYGVDSFAKLWDAAVRSAGYLLLQSHLLSEMELVKTFVAEAEDDFVEEVALETRRNCDRAFKDLEAMAAADGVYMDLERKCIQALLARVRELRNHLIAERYPHAVVFDK